MHINTLRPRIEQTQVFFQLADTHNRRLQHALDVDALLWVHDLVVACLELAVDVDVLDVQGGQVVEDFFVLPRFNVLFEYLK